MAVAVVVIGLLVVQYGKSLREEAQRRNVFAVTLSIEGWSNDKLLGRRYELFYPGAIGKPPLDCRVFEEVYAALGCEAQAESVRDGCSLLFPKQPERVVYAVYVSRQRALLIIGGPVRQAEAEQMSDAVIGLARSVGVKATGVSSVASKHEQTQHWEFTFEYEAK
jgi:hypothetical protein